MPTRSGVLRGDRPERCADRQLPAGLHAPRAHRCRAQPRRGPRPGLLTMTRPPCGRDLTLEQTRSMADRDFNATKIDRMAMSGTMDLGPSRVKAEPGPAAQRCS